MNKTITQRQIKTLLHSGLFSCLDILQILKVLAGNKQGTRLLFSGKQKTEKIKKILENQNIPFAVRESETFAGIKDKGKGGWSNLCSSHSRVKNYALYIGIDRNCVQQAFDAEGKQDDSLFGTTLSYPECCNQFFNSNFSNAYNLQGDLFPFVYENTSRNTGELPFLLNPLWYFDSGFIEYWPCSFRCPVALEDAQRTYSLLYKYLPKIAKKMEHLLKNPVVYTEYSGVFIFPDSSYVEKDMTLYYNAKKIIKTDFTSLFKYLSMGDRLVLKNNSYYIYQGMSLVHKIRNEKFCLARFTGESNSATKGDKILSEIKALGIDVPQTTIIEALMLMNGVKKSLRLIVKPADLKKAKKLARILNVNYYVSPLRVAIVAHSATGDHYVDYRKTVEPDADFLICYAKNQADAKTCADLEASGDSCSGHKLNDFLNYPQCCVDSFKTRKPHADWIKPFLKRTPISTWYPTCTNRLGYLFSGEMLLYDYEPCSAFCSGSLSLGRKISTFFKEFGLTELWNQMIDSVSDPILLIDGLLVKINNCHISSSVENRITLRYRTNDFEIRDYNLKPSVEHSPLWKSDKLVLQGNKIRIYKGKQFLCELLQQQNNNRIFLFKEIYDETTM